ncbi:hypothetical protein HRI_002382500 [Hibiscus trionum]|uniref:MBD domain-containing protein n=1 Tax=Hibiscus trionum TaxID=183268 RepID=A0A9W7I1N9_HIBTR|nr:hypothetical protein HRI_002382500 [Hibiscus trionum]
MASTREQPANLSKARRLSPPPGFSSSSQGRKVSPPPGFEQYRASKGRSVSPPQPDFGEQWSPETLATLQKIRERQRQGKDRKKPGGSERHFDNTELRYSWLLPGWVAEERIVPSGRLYRYYYDPIGRQYRTKYEVLYTWERMGIICLDL